MVLLRALLVLLGRPVPREPVELAAAAAAAMGTDGEPLLNVVRHRATGLALPARRVRRATWTRWRGRRRFSTNFSWEISDDALVGGPESLLALVLLASGCGYNTIQTMDEEVNQAKGRSRPSCSAGPTWSRTWSRR